MFLFLGLAIFQCVSFYQKHYGRIERIADPESDSGEKRNNLETFREEYYKNDSDTNESDDDLKRPAVKRLSAKKEVIIYPHQPSSLKFFRRLLIEGDPRFGSLGYRIAMECKNVGICLRAIRGLLIVGQMTPEMTSKVLDILPGQVHCLERQLLCDLQYSALAIECADELVEPLVKSLSVLAGDVKKSLISTTDAIINSQKDSCIQSLKDYADACKKYEDTAALYMIYAPNSPTMALNISKYYQQLHGDPTKAKIWASQASICQQRSNMHSFQTTSNSNFPYFHNFGLNYNFNYNNFHNFNNFHNSNNFHNFNNFSIHSSGNFGSGFNFFTDSSPKSFPWGSSSKSMHFFPWSNQNSVSAVELDPSQINRMKSQQAIKQVKSRAVLFSSISLVFTLALFLIILFLNPSSANSNDLLSNNVSNILLSGPRSMMQCKVSILLTAFRIKNESEVNFFLRNPQLSQENMVEKLNATLNYPENLIFGVVDSLARMIEGMDKRFSSAQEAQSIWLSDSINIASMYSVSLQALLSTVFVLCDHLAIQNSAIVRTLVDPFLLYLSALQPEIVLLENLFQDFISEAISEYEKIHYLYCGVILLVLLVLLVGSVLLFYKFAKNEEMLIWSVLFDADQKYIESFRNFLVTSNFGANFFSNSISNSRLSSNANSSEIIGSSAGYDETEQENHEKYENHEKHENHEKYENHENHEKYENHENHEKYEKYGSGYNSKSPHSRSQKRKKKKNTDDINALTVEEIDDFEQTTDLDKTTLAPEEVEMTMNDQVPIIVHTDGGMIVGSGENSIVRQNKKQIHPAFIISTIATFVLVTVFLFLREYARLCVLRQIGPVTQYFTALNRATCYLAAVSSCSALLTVDELQKVFPKVVMNSFVSWVQFDFEESYQKNKRILKVPYQLYQELHVLNETQSRIFSQWHQQIHHDFDENLIEIVQIGFRNATSIFQEIKDWQVSMAKKQSTNLSTISCVFMIFFVIVACFYIVSFVARIVTFSQQFQAMKSFLLLPSPYLSLVASFISRHEESSFRNAKSASETSQKLQARYILKQSLDSIIVIDAQQRIQDVNNSTEKMLGFRKDELIGRNIMDIISNTEDSEYPEQGGGFFSQLTYFNRQPASSPNAAPRFNFHIIRADQSTIPVNCTLISIQGSAENDLPAFAVVLRDRTVFNELEKKLQDAKKSVETLLYKIMPRVMATKLLSKNAHLQTKVERATVIFIGIVDFLGWCRKHSHTEIMEQLDQIVSKFDSKITKFPTLVKIKVINGVYMAAGGLFNEVSQKNQELEAVEFAVKCIRAVGCEDDPSKSVKLVIGINTGGPIISGILGVDKPLFDIWGDTVNVAARLETSAPPDHIQISHETMVSLPPDRFQIEEKPNVFLKGKGFTTTYLISPEKKKKHPSQGEEKPRKSVTLAEAIPKVLLKSRAKYTLLSRSHQHHQEAEMENENPDQC